MPTRILVVDDEPHIESLMLQRFRRKIQAGDYQFAFAGSGRAALASISDTNDPDVLLLDINMPDMDGLTLLAEIGERLPNSRAVMVSAYGDLGNIRAAMNRGAFDFVTKPINFQDLELTIEKTARHVSQLRDSIREKAVAALKARFFDNITHEFRTPLSLILAPLDTLLCQEPLAQPVRRQLTVVQRNARQLQNLINQLLDLAKLEAGSLPVIETGGDAVLYTRQVVDTFSPLAEQRDIDLRFSTDTPTYAGRFDADKWEKIMANLLSNALKFTGAGGQVNVALSPTATGIQLIVQDTGIGIAANYLPHIFDRFYQIESSSIRNYEGTGIGLALVSELIARLDGQIRVHSRIDAPTGTTFTVDLPVSPADGQTGSTAQPLPSTRPLPLSAQSIDIPADGTTDNRPLLLLVEDNADLLAFTADALTESYRVLTATNGRIGLELARQELPDLVVTDLMMPEMDGLELTRQLKTDPTTDHIAVILLTARATRQDRLTGLLGGADDYLTKPFDLRELHLRLHNILQRQQTLRDYYQRQFSSPMPAPALPPEPSVQDVFLQKLYAIVEAHLDDSTFRAEALAEEVSMSIRTLTRKLTTLAGESPAHLIRTYRLRRATDLLRAGHPVSETAYMVGFEHPANFTTAFKDVYGRTPSDFLATR
ncbi:response regulator [Spirosoma rhododendri]|uniref:histidine kinase n=1 Tax=Spirosoma rhododendri TaxID=2728024 RepID=A0A7L5DM74_9BACT|nr:response regulator [Spirosoma rhododendri]QJD77167.1 response regulator [Spirosoma rhododendri]